MDLHAQELIFENHLSSCIAKIIGLHSGALQRDADGGGWIPWYEMINQNRFGDRGGEGEIRAWKEGDTIEYRQEVNFFIVGIFWGGYRNNITVLSVAKGLEYVPYMDRYPLIMLQDVTNPVGKKDIPFLWRIPNAVESTMNIIITQLFNLRRP